MRVRLTHVYDEFGWGVHDIVAIRNFLKYARNNWSSSSHYDFLDYVWFIGDGDYDYRSIVSVGGS